MGCGSSYVCVGIVLVVSQLFDNHSSDKIINSCTIGSENKVAMTLIVQHVRDQLQKVDCLL